jgi:thioredoxin-dependent peroxiredoxin
MMIAAGQPAPEFEVSDHTGRPVKLSDFRGRHVLLWFYPEADTPGCTKEGCGFRDLKNEFAKQNAEILGVSFDEPAKNAAFVQKFSFNFPLLSDTDRRLGLAYGACDAPDAPRARRVSYLIGPDGRVEQAYGFEAKMDAAAHPAAVLADLEK